MAILLWRMCSLVQLVSAVCVKHGAIMLACLAVWLESPASMLSHMARILAMPYTAQFSYLLLASALVLVAMSQTSLHTTRFQAMRTGNLPAAGTVPAYHMCIEASKMKMSRLGEMAWRCCRLAVCRLRTQGVCVALWHSVSHSKCLAHISAALLQAHRTNHSVFYQEKFVQMKRWDFHTCQQLSSPATCKDPFLMSQLLDCTPNMSLAETIDRYCIAATSVIALHAFLFVSLAQTVSGHYEFGAQSI